MLEAAILDCLFLDLFPFSENGFVPPEVGIGRCEVVGALVVALVVVVFDKGPDLVFEIARPEIVFQKYAVFHGLVPPLDFALGLWMTGRAAHVFHLLFFQPLGQVARDVA